jgi:CubicO group peptidase (beta-lactamase class C family)
MIGDEGSALVSRFRQLFGLAGVASLALSACEARSTATAVFPSLPTAEPLASPSSTPKPTEAPTAVPSQAGTIDFKQIKEDLDSWVPAAIRAGGGSACSMAVVSPDAGTGVLEATFFNYGTLAKDLSMQVDASTEYEIGSLSKLLTGDLLAEQVQAKSVALDDPVEKYLPAGVWMPSYGGQAITLRQLATHTSGLPRDLGTSPITTVDGHRVIGYATQAQIFDFLDTYQLLRAPGSKWEYSNLANGLLGLIEERVGNKSYEKLVVQNILEPLGLRDTRVMLDPDQKSRLASGYGDKGGAAPPFAETGDMLAAGGFRSTAQDMAAYLVANMQPDQTRLSSVLRMTLQSQGIGPTNDGAMGLGWIIAREGAPQQQYYKTGSTAGYNSYFAFWPTSRVGYVLMCNGQPVDELAPKVNEALSGSSGPANPGG